ADKIESGSMLVDGSVKSYLFFFSSRRRHTRLQGDWSSDVCSSDLRSASSRATGWGTCTSSASGANTSAARSIGTIARSTSCPEKIGRASCRERVWDWGGGVSMDKKQMRHGELCARRRQCTYMDSSV